MIGKLICLVTRKHKRGKLVDKVTVQPRQELRTYKCPRCGASHSRKFKVKAHAAA